MKKLIILFWLMFTTVSFAETITIINNGKAGGSYNARTLMYKEGLEARGFDVTYENIGKISQAVKVFKTTDKPTIMVFSSNQSNRQDLLANGDNFILLEYEQPMYICSTNASEGKEGTITVAHGKGYNPELLKQILGDRIVLVPYKNSGAMLKGILGGDVDMMVNNQGKSLKYISSGQGNCYPSKKLPKMMAIVLGKNIDVIQIRNHLKSVLNDKAFVEYHSKKKLQRSNAERDTELKSVNESEADWQ